MMGISHALFEEVMFDESGITTDDWIAYPIPTMSDAPEIKVVLINNPKVGAYGGGSEAPNALAAPAIAAALHDATGKVIRRLPMKAAYTSDFESLTADQNRSTGKAGRLKKLDSAKYGHQAKRFTAFRQGPGGLVHRHGADRPIVSSARSGVRTRRQRHV